MSTIMIVEVETAQVERVYAEDIHVTVLPKYFELLDTVRTYKEISDNLYKLGYKALCNIVREKIGISNVIGLAEAFDEEENLNYLTVQVFPIEATNDNFYDMHLDEERNEFYVEVQA